MTTRTDDTPSARPRRRPTHDALQQSLFDAETSITDPGTSDAPFSDRRYQVECVARIVDGLRHGGRGQVRAACGTGKTSIARWSAERLLPQGGIVVITAPTVGLVGQTIAAWAHSGVDHQVLAVCSDPTVADDSPGHAADFVEPVTTDSDVIDTWLRRPTGHSVRLIVGTHQSAHIIGEGLQKAGRYADLLIIDEAHRTAGTLDKIAAQVHDDVILPAARRLYMTATARIALSSNGDGQVLSMDDESIFGPVLYDYPFSVAINDGYLDDYRIAVVGVTKAEVLTALRQAAATASGRGLPSEHTAMVQAAISRAAADLGLRRVIAFCPRIADAHEFAHSFGTILSALPADKRPARTLHSEHISGQMNNRRRREILQRLAHPPRDGWSVISNARCLSEGIDVPTVDAVAFTSPKKSVVDIVQAVGRALRRDPDGTGTATIIVPILLPDTADDIDGAFNAGDYNVLWQVVLALRAHDDAFSAALDGSRAHGDRAPSAVLDRLNFLMPGRFQAPEFLEHLTIRLIRSATSAWWDSYGLLLRFHAREGHCDVPASHREDGFALGQWMAHNRSAHRQRRLAPERLEALLKLGYHPDGSMSAVKQRRGLAAAKLYYAEHGNLRPPQLTRVRGVQLNAWLARQRKLSAEGRLDPEHVRELDAMGMEWKVTFTHAERVEQLRRFHAEHGRLPTQRESGTLHNAILTLRRARGSGELDQALVDTLDRIGMPWSPVRAAHEEAQWNRGVAAATRFRAMYGHLVVHESDPLPEEDVGYNLHSWVSNVRTRRGQGRLSAAREAQLDALGMVWSVQQAAWENAIAACADFYAVNGHLRVPQDHVAQDIRNEPYLLQEWLANRRETKERLTEEEIAQLDAVGMVWSPYGHSWEALLGRFSTYHATFGNLDVPQKYVVDGFALGAALTHLRVRRRRGTLAPDREAALDRLGVDWDPGVYGRRRRMMEALRAFHSEHGHISVPSTLCDSKGRPVAPWLTLQRTLYKRGELAPEAIADLEAVGMIWDGRESKWEHTIRALRQFHALYGHLAVTYQDARREPLCRTVYEKVTSFRKQRSAGQLAQWKIATLDALGMDWTIPTRTKPSLRTPEGNSRAGQVDADGPNSSADSGGDIGGADASDGR